MEKGSSSSSSAGAYAGPDSLHGLCLGLRPKTGAAPPKKGRCQVEGCNLDLSDAKPYYSRHKVCGAHSKTPKVIVAGIEQRFCQQCSRFHRLPEFDQGKRSCRRRLAGHNERRRKPPQGCKDFRPTGFDNNHITKTGGFVMAFSPYSSFPTPSPERGLPSNRASITGKYELPLQSNSPQNPLYDLLACRPISSIGPVVSSQDRFNGIPTNGVSDSSNALSLLSSQPWPGPKTHLGVNSFPDNNPGSTVGYFVCSPWNFKGNRDLGSGQASQPSNAGQGLGQAREYDSPAVGHLMHRSL